MKEKLEYGGQIKDFPPEVVEKMLEKQVEQGNKRDISVFEKNSRLNARHGGFKWRDTIEGRAFWSSVVGNYHFENFFNRYPRIETIEFTHCWVSEFGWENTILLPEDFIEVEKLGESEKDGIVFIATNDAGGKHILKGRYVK